MSKIIVIGANHAGTAAINTILDNYEDDVVVFDGNSNISVEWHYGSENKLMDQKDYFIQVKNYWKKKVQLYTWKR